MSKALEKAQDKLFEAKLDKRAQQAAKDLQGHVSVIKSGQDSPVVSAFNQVAKKNRRRKLN